MKNLPRIFAYDKKNPAKNGDNYFFSTRITKFHKPAKQQQKIIANQNKLKFHN